MVILKGQTPLAGRIFWEVRDASDPDVLTMLIDHVIAGGRAVTIPGVQYPEEEREAWTFNLDAMKEQVLPEVARAFPPWARGRITAEPTLAGSMWRFDITPEMLGSS